MVDRAELVDAIAGFSLFADLTGPQLEGIVHLFEEAVFSEGDKVLRQGLTGSGFYVILDGEAAIVVDGTERARLGRGEFFGEVSIILGESPIADVVATRPLRCLVLPGPHVEAFLLALRLGATGLESDVWLTADGEAVLDHDGAVGSLRKRPIRRRWDC